MTGYAIGGIPLSRLPRVPSLSLTLTATTTGAAQTVRINRVRASEDTQIAWGDGTVTPVPRDTNVDHTHTYAAAGVYDVSVPKAHRITHLRLSESRISNLKTAELRNSVLASFYLSAGIHMINSADMTGWNPSLWYCTGLTTGGTYDLNSVHMQNWKLQYFWVTGLPIAGTYVFNSLDMQGWIPDICYLNSMAVGTYNIDTARFATWNPVDVRLNNLPPASTTWTIAAADFAGFRRTTYLRMDDNAFARAGANPVDVDDILYGMYLASVTPRTGAAGTINVGGTNEAPTGVFQAAGAPVTAATDGKEVQHELLNDGEAVGFNTWATVTVTA